MNQEEGGGTDIVEEKKKWKWVDATPEEQREMHREWRKQHPRKRRFQDVHAEKDPDKRLDEIKNNNMNNRHGKQALIGQYFKGEALLEEVWDDILDGVPKYKIVAKLQKAPDDGGYSRAPKAYSREYSNTIYNTAEKRIGYLMQENIERKREVCWGRFERIYTKAMEAKNLAVARETLRDMMKLFGLSQEKPTTAVQINTSKDGIKVNFGFLNKDNEDDDEDNGSREAEFEEITDES